MLRWLQQDYGLDALGANLLLDLVSAGLISMEAAIYASSNPEEFERSIRLEG